MTSFSCSSPSADTEASVLATVNLTRRRLGAMDEWPVLGTGTACALVGDAYQDPGPDTADRRHVSDHLLKASA